MTFLWSLYNVLVKKRGHLTDNLGANMIKHLSAMELYIILSTLEKSSQFKQTFLISFNHEISVGQKIQVHCHLQLLI